MRVSVAARSNPFVYAVFALQPKYRKIRFRKSRTEMVIDGFPRSGNSWLYNAIDYLYPTRSLAHHMHSLVPISLGLRKGVPVYVPIRGPIDSITSFAIFLSDKSAGQIRETRNARLARYCVEQYCSFYAGLARLVDGDRGRHLRLIQMNKIFDGGALGREEICRLIELLAADCGVSKQAASPELLMEEVRRRHSEYDLMKETSLHKLATPNPAKEAEKSHIACLVKDDPRLVSIHERAERLFLLTSKHLQQQF